MKASLSQQMFSLAAELDFPKDAMEHLSLQMEKLQKNGEAHEAFLNILASYGDENVFSLEEANKKMKEISACASIHEYTGYLLMLLALSLELRRKYAKRGIDDGIFLTTLRDLKYKIEECRLVKGVIGNFVPHWYANFFRLALFGFVRLQFEQRTLLCDCTVDGCELKEGMPVLSVHIPRAETRLTHEAVIASYDAAAEFFRDYFKDSPVIFICNSWLLFPRHEQMLKPDSNVLAFMRDYTVVREGLYDGYDQLWRLFDMDYTGNPDDLPADSSMRRAYVDLVKRGERHGWGYGVIVYKK